MQNDAGNSAKKRFDVFGVMMEFLIAPDNDSQQTSLVRGSVPAGLSVPLHSHPEPELFYILDGTIDIYRAADEPLDWTAVHKDQTFVVPGGVKHALRNASGETCVALVATGPSLYSFFREIGRPITAGYHFEPPTPEALQSLFVVAEKHQYWMGSPQDNASIGLVLPGVVSR